MNVEVTNPAPVASQGVRALRRPERRPTKIWIITSALPPKLDGIGDYSALLSAELAKSADVTVVCGSQNPDHISGVTVQTPYSALDPQTVKHILPCIAAGKPDWVVLQYCPFGYGRWGLNLQLPIVMQAIRRHSPETRVALMVHEPYVPIDNYKFAVFTTWQRWQLWQLGRNADIVFLSIEPWAKKFQPWFPKKEVSCLAVGSNIPYVQTDRKAIRRELGISEQTVVLGYFGTIHPSRLTSWVRGALEAVIRTGRDAVVLYVGPGCKIMDEVLAGLPHLNTGALPAYEVSRAFSAMDIHLSTFDDGISTRRGSFIAGIQHGLPTVGTFGRSTSSELLAHNGAAFMLTDTQAEDRFYEMVCDLAGDTAKRKRMGLEASRLFEQEFAWNKIARKLTDRLAETNSPK